MKHFTASDLSLTGNLLFRQDEQGRFQLTAGLRETQSRKHSTQTRERDIAEIPQLYLGLEAGNSQKAGIAIAIVCPSVPARKKDGDTDAK